MRGVVVIHFRKLTGVLVHIHTAARKVGDGSYQADFYEICRRKTPHDAFGFRSI